MLVFGIMNVQNKVYIAVINMTKSMEEIVGIDVDYDNIPDDWQTSQDVNAVNYRRALARASNAIEGVILSDADKAFMDSFSPDTPRQEFISKVKAYLGV